MTSLAKAFAALLCATALSSAPALAKTGETTETAASAPSEIVPIDPASLDLTRGIEARTLDNGLEVVVIPDRRAPVVTHMIWYRAGAADEPRGKSGIAHYLEHLLFKGTPDVPMGEFSGAVAAVGGRENAFTSQDYTAYFQRVAPDQLGTMMAYEADRMVNLELTEEMIATERQVILEERASRIGASPGAELGQAVGSALFANHPYGTPIIGWRDEISGLTAEDAIDFYKRFYRPDNAVVVIAGDVDPAEAFRLAKETYGRIEVDGDPPVRERPAEPESRVTRTVELSDPRVARPSVSLSWLAPSYETAENEREAYALDMLADILSGGTTTRLYRELVVEDAVAAGAGAYYDGSPLDLGRFTLSITPADGVTVGEAEEAIRAELARVAEEGVTQQELDRARDRLFTSVVFARDNQATMARILGASFAGGSDLTEIREWPERMAAVTPADVQEAAKRFTGDNFVRAILRPTESVSTASSSGAEPDSEPIAQTEPAAAPETVR